VKRKNSHAFSSLRNSLWHGHLGHAFEPSFWRTMAPLEVSRGGQEESRRSQEAVAGREHRRSIEERFRRNTCRLDELCRPAGPQLQGRVLAAVPNARHGYEPRAPGVGHRSQRAAAAGAVAVRRPGRNPGVRPQRRPGHHYADHFPYPPGRSRRRVRSRYPSGTAIIRFRAQGDVRNRRK